MRALDPEPKEGAKFDKTIGLSLLFGFSFMLLVDKSVNGNGHNHSAPISVHELRDMEYGFEQSSTPTLGLVVHAAADGVAMGAAFVAEQSQLELVLFFAILLHKAPTAFGLVSFLLQRGLSKRRILNHLCIFELI
jgi:zinc transporter 9